MSKKVGIIACISSAILLGLCGLYFYTRSVSAPAVPSAGQQTYSTAVSAQPLPTVVPETGPWHAHISTTVFWVGEVADSDNGFIPNHQSAWDGDWTAHFGGTDTPHQRKGYFPAAFTPAENPFYIALPYSDIDDRGDPKPERYCAKFSPQPDAVQQCKNTWVEISYRSKSVYAQWQDAGPFGEDDTAYVFGQARPSNTVNNSAGLDVSPATRDYLGFDDNAIVRWRFVKAVDVPLGPWRVVVTD